VSSSLCIRKIRTTWNSLPPSVVNCDTLSVFKSRQKKLTCSILHIDSLPALPAPLKLRHYGALQNIIMIIMCMRTAVRRLFVGSCGRWLADCRGRPCLLPAQLHALQAAVLLHLTHHVRHTELSATHVYAQRDLSAHHGPVPVLPSEPAALAELDPTQSVVQRLLRQGSALRWKARSTIDVCWSLFHHRHTWQLTNKIE